MKKKTTKRQNRATELIDKITNRTANAGVIGLGYVGLPLSIALANAGFKVTGFDISESKVKLLNSGKSDIDDVPDSRNRQ